MRTSALLSTATKSWWWSSSSPRMQTPRLAISLARWNCATLSALSLLAPNNNLSYNIVSLQFFFCSLLCSCDALYFNNISLLVLEIPSGFVGLSSIFFPINSDLFQTNLHSLTHMICFFLFDFGLNTLFKLNHTNLAGLDFWRGGMHTDCKKIL